MLSGPTMWSSRCISRPCNLTRSQKCFVSILPTAELSQINGYRLGIFMALKTSKADMDSHRPVAKIGRHGEYEIKFRSIDACVIFDRWNRIFGTETRSMSEGLCVLIDGRLLVGVTEWGHCMVIRLLTFLSIRIEQMLD